jgi:hypothetical protein
MRTFMSALAAAAIAGGVIAGPAQANLITNGSFESTAVSTSLHYIYPNATLDSWTYSGSGVIDARGANDWYPIIPSPTLFDGFQYGFVQGKGSLTQTFSGAGEVKIAWLDAGRPYSWNCCGGEQTYKVILDGNTIQTNTTHSSPYGATFTAEGLFFNLGAGSPTTTHTLTFLGTSPTDNTAFIDQVSVTGVPELSTWAMMIIGFGGVGLQMRRRDRAVGLSA